MGSNHSSSAQELEPMNVSKKINKSERRRSYSHFNGKIQITPQTIQDILANIRKLIDLQPLSLNYIISEIECKLNEEMIRQILVTLSMKQGLKQFQFGLYQIIFNLEIIIVFNIKKAGISSKNQNDSIVQNVVQQTLIELLLPPFFDNFALKSRDFFSINSQEAKKLLFDQLKKDIKDFKQFCYKFFAIIFRKINLSTKGSLVQQIILETFFKPCSVDDYCTRKRIKEFIYMYFRIYENYYLVDEQTLQSYIQQLDITETSNVESFKKNIISNNYYSRCMKKMNKIFSINIDSDFLIISNSLQQLIEEFNRYIFEISQSYFADGADSRQVLNINFITLFKIPNFFTCCNFMLDNFENILEPSQKHLITTLNISFEQIMYYINEQYEGIQMNIQSQITLSQIHQYQTDALSKQLSIS